MSAQGAKDASGFDLSSWREGVSLSWAWKVQVVGWGVGRVWVLSLRCQLLSGEAGMRGRCEMLEEVLAITKGLWVSRQKIRLRFDLWDFPV